MSRQLIKRIVVFVSILVIGSVAVYAEYIPNSRDTKESPEAIVYTIDRPLDMVLLHENDNFEFYFRDELDVLAIYDKTSGFTYKTGLDIPINDDVEDACDDLLDTDTYTAQDVEDTCLPIADLSNAAKQYVNSFLTVEYLEEVGSRTKNLYSADDDYDSELSQIEGGTDHWVLDVDYKKYDIEIRVHLYFDDLGLSYEIRDEEIEADEPKKLLSIAVTPFMGAQGGSTILFDDVALEYDDAFAVSNTLNPGYSFIPDGSGALIRYEDTNIDVDDYVGDVYGDDLTNYYYHYQDSLEYLEAKAATLPVFGMSFGDDTESAFVAFATSGDEYMQVISVPLSSTLGYVQTYGKFIYSSPYRQVFNEAGDGYERLPDDRNHFDLEMRYEFLNGDGSTDSRPASYVGMALAYREYLLDTGILTENVSTLSNIPIRVDFLMADSKVGIFGYEEQVATRMSDVEDMLLALHDDGVLNINGGLLGWQSGGVVLSSPDDMDFTNTIGSKSTYEDLVSNMSALGYDISLSQDFVTINNDMMTLRGNAVKHANGMYYTYNLLSAQTILEAYLAKPELALDWLSEYTEKIVDLGGNSITVDGLSSKLYGSPYEDLTITEVKELIYNGFTEANSELVIAGSNPNIYLLSAIDRYLNTPVYSTQYIIASDTVPFLELVLYNTVEMYAPYANFSFSSDSDILRMVDYNVYPSFVLTKEPSYVLGNTDSNEFISTQFRDYEDLITDIYGEVDSALKNVINEDWMNREVLENGVILNSYTNDKYMIINYTDETVTYNGEIVAPYSYLFFEE